MPEDKDNRQERIQWRVVVTNAISALVAAMFVGAGAIVWNASISQPQAIR